MHSHVDLLILGGGCAGLSLASRLAEFGKDAPKVLIIEQRESYTNDRTWCFWDIEKPAYQSLTSHAWSKFEVANHPRSNVYNCSQYQYLMLESHHFYENALGLIRSNASIQLLLGQEVLSAPIKTEHGWYIKTGNLEFTAKQVLDTRPPKQVSHHDSVLWQSFVGYEIQTESDYFSPEQMVLMEFDHTFKSGLAFTYILPTTEKKALIEYTVFSENRMSEEELMEGLKKSIGQHIAGSPYKILRVEHGILPMGNKLATQNNDSSYLFAGLFEGAARPSSGYAFQRIQSWANKCAHSMLANNTLYAFPKEKRLQSFMDGLFLNVIKKNPTIAASLFEDLFRRCNLKTVVKFMSDQASSSDCLQIIRALPPKPFIEALPRFIIQKISNRLRLTS